MNDVASGRDERRRGEWETNRDVAGGRDERRRGEWETNRDVASGRDERRRGEWETNRDVASGRDERRRGEWETNRDVASGSDDRRGEWARRAVCSVALLLRVPLRVMRASLTSPRWADMRVAYCAWAEWFCDWGRGAHSGRSV
jgi:hypothetical protein